MVKKSFAQSLALFNQAALLLDSFDMASSRKKLKEYRDTAFRAFVDQDQQLYTETLEDMKTFTESVNKSLLERLQGRKQRELPPDQLAILMLQDIHQRLKKLSLAAFVSGRNDLQESLQALVPELDEIQGLLEQDPGEVIRWCQLKRGDLDRIQRQMTGGMEESSKIKDGVLGVSAVPESENYDLTKGEKNKGGTR